MTDTTSPTALLIADAIEASGKTQREIATEMGFERANVISMMKSGDMRIPLERIPAFAAATGVDSESLLKSAMLEYMPETWNVVAKSKRAAGPAALVPEAQINIRGPAPVIERFKHLCAEDRRTYPEMLELLLIAAGQMSNRA
ncbi:helix-turn-helix domain-containing protein [Histidinibacterium aquaticum]|uniref:Helix-turn-helix transcriptional regulator n=1 Tax=Histidinibacterium aquaticum TaxID=2613962 RepID=A0A5J5GNZ1_9RHOB|nr:helix-turn-helix transcriptional regulator [Histidinibacterium aquaticum]KAA9010039.1 helix-turn-helix transcriptional regulator [Histidinibacterium aquaticum]